MALHAQKKGKRGEKEFCEFLMQNFTLAQLSLNADFEDKIQRNFNQSDGHSADIIVRDFIFEVKRREVEDLDSWWYQVCMAKQKHKNQDLIQVVAFRANRQQWEFLIPARLIGVELGWMRVPERVFLQLAEKILK